MSAPSRLSTFSLLFVLLFAAAACLPASAQVHGVPPSVTSFGFGGSNNPAPGIPASVTSLGPFGWGNGFGFGGFGFGNCCVGFGPGTASFPGQRFGGRRGHHHHDQFQNGEMTGGYAPVYVPYAVPVPYAADEAGYDDDAGAGYTDSGDPAMAYDSGAPVREASRARRTAAAPPPVRTEAAAPSPAAEPAPEAPAPVRTQPVTVLVFKDGHKAEVQNYAIVGDTLFEFSDNRTHKIQLADLDLTATQKANDDRGVDFQLPAKKDKAK